MSQVVEHLAELTAYRDRDLLDATLAGALQDLLHPQAVAIYRTVGEPGQQRWLLRARLEQGDSVAGADALWTDVALLPLLESQPLRLTCLRTQQPTERAPDAASGAPALTCFALVGDSEAVGVLEVSTQAPLTATDLRLVDSILRVYRNFYGLLDYSERDTLTGLLNRKTFDESFLRVMVQEAQAQLLPPSSEARRHLPPGHGWLAVVDIDHFKQVNDGYGHLIGDEVLLLLSRLMRGSFRYHDQLYRFGGEEFVVLMRCTHVADATAALERLRSQVERYAFPQVGGITVSVGFTEVRAGDTPGGAFERADQAVYHAKQNGRNRVAYHAELVASGQLPDNRRDSDVELF